MKKILVVVILVVISSCEFFRIEKGVKIVEVGDYILYESDINTLFNEGISEEDSLAILRSYVDSWVVQKVKLLNAEKGLQKEDLDVERELDNYRTALIVYRFENEYVLNHLDTIIDSEEMLSYYQQHIDDFISTESVVKARCIMIHHDSPNLKSIERLYKSSNVDKIEELNELCYSSAYRFDNFNFNWVGLSKIASFLKVQPSEAETIFNWRSSFTKKDAVYIYLVHLFEKVKAGDELPFDYVEKEVRQKILNQRKVDLLRKLEKESLRTGYMNNEIKIYIADENH